MDEIRQLIGTEEVSNSEGRHVVRGPQEDVAEDPGCGPHFLSITAPVTIPPTEQDLKLFQFVQHKNGRIKRPMNAFFVWARVHRSAFQKACPLTSNQNINTELGRVWSLLTAEQKRPYFEVAHKLRILHDRRFPDYKYQPKKRQHREQSTTEQRATAAGQQQRLSNPAPVLQAAPSTLPTFSMSAYPVLAPRMMYSNPYLFTPSYQNMHAPMFQIHSPRLFPTSTVHQAIHGTTAYSSSPAEGGVYSGYFQHATACFGVHANMTSGRPNVNHLSP